MPTMNFEAMAMAAFYRLVAAAGRALPNTHLISRPPTVGSVCKSALWFLAVLLREVCYEDVYSELGSGVYVGTG